MSPDEIERAIDTIAAQVGMPIPAECRPGVLENTARMQQIAQAFLAFELPPQVEPAAVFRA